MIPSKIWTIFNVILVIISILLLLPLFDVTIPTIGQARYYLDSTKPLCVISWQDQLTEWNDLNRCCLEARKQLVCEKAAMTIEGELLNRVCYTGHGDVLKYWLNNKAYHYCTLQPIWGHN